MNHKKTSTIFIVIFVLVAVMSFNLPSSFSLDGETLVRRYGTYEEAKKIIKEVMKDYYLKETNIQYHNSRRKVPGLPPEDATSQDIQYTVCSGYVYNSYSSAFKMDTVPRTTEAAITAAANYYHDSSAPKDGNFLIYYENTITGEKYAYKNKKKFSDFVNLIQPGDIFVFSGHAMIAYDVVVRDNGQKDVLLLNSNGTSDISSRLYSTRALTYSYRTTHAKNNVLDVAIEGGVQYKWLSGFTSRFVANTISANDEITSTPGHSASKYKCDKRQLIYYTFDSQNNKYVAHGPRCDSSKEYIGIKNGIKVVCANDEMFVSNKSIGTCEDLQASVYNNELSCQMDECVVIRPYYNCDGSACFNYDISPTAYDNSTFRLDYPGIYVEKTVNKGDNNTVYPDDELVYTLKVTNKSNASSNTSERKKYTNLVIEETVDNNVTLLSSTGNGTITGNVIKWNISSLAVGSSVQMTYTVKVKPNINQTINATGKIYGSSKPNASITTGGVSNFIAPKVSPPTKSYESCYNTAVSKKKKGLDLIDYVYSCSRNMNFNFASFKFDDLFSKKKTESDQIYFKTTLNDNALTFKKMILNNYWGGDTIVSNNGNYYLAPLKWIGNAASRNYTINDIDFKDGDVLIYSIDYDTGIKNQFNNNEYYVTPATLRFTSEKGLYAFIYINGSFVGLNGSGDTARNSFTYNYYGNDISSIYPNYTNVKSSDRENVNKFINYETLLDKDYYIILRPELIILNEESISVKTMPNKTSYYLNESLDLTGLGVNVKYNNGTTESVSLDKLTITGFSSTSAGSKKITVKYNGLTTSFNITVLNEEVTSLSNRLKNNGYQIKNALVSGFKIGTTVSELKNKLGDSSITINTSNTIVATGVTIKKGSESYTIVVKGDLTGDGKVNSGDLLQMRKYLLEDINLTGPYKESGIIESTNDIKSLDLLRLRQYLLGDYTFK